jgi:hypothetical protein
LLVLALPLTAAAEMKIEVKALRNPDWGRYRAFIAGMEEFESNKRRLAPKASLRYRIYPLHGEQQMAAIGMRIETDDSKIEIPVSSDGYFSLPIVRSAIDGNAEIVVNRRRGTFGWQAVVRSPGTTDAKGRLGDYRLECQVRWAVVRRSTPAEQLEQFGSAPCLDNFRHTFYSSRPVATVLLVDHDFKWQLPPENILEGGHRYVVPLNMATFRDSTEVHLTYRDGAGGGPTALPLTRGAEAHVVITTLSRKIPHPVRP